MKGFLFLKVLFVILFVNSATCKGQVLEDLKWKNRILIVKTTKTYSEKMEAQLHEFKKVNKELIERKLVLFVISGDEFSFVDFKADHSNYSGKIRELGNTNMFGKRKDFEVILIGLDGGIKLKQEDVLSKESLFSTIDTMPMRRAEIRN